MTVQVPLTVRTSGTDAATGRDRHHGLREIALQVRFAADVDLFHRHGGSEIHLGSAMGGEFLGDGLVFFGGDATHLSALARASSAAFCSSINQFFESTSAIFLTIGSQARHKAQERRRLG